jgi:branched-chain amino acid transport system substrate-binding protein
MGTSTAPIKLGVIADLTGPMSFMGIADANVGRMVVDEVNAAGGLLDRPIELHIEDSETTDEAAEAAAAKLVQDVQVDVIFGGILSSTSPRAGLSISTPSNTRGRSATR